MGGSSGQKMPELWTGAANAGESINFPIPNSQFGGIVGSASNAIGRTGDTMQNFFAGKLGTGAQPRPDYKPDMTSPEQKQQQNQYMKDLLSKVGQTASSPYDRAAKSQSDSASAWSAMQRGSADGSGSLDFSSMGAYSVPETGEEKVTQAWGDAIKSVLTSSAGAYGSKFGGANKIG
jgi:hypothetical protein